tara:strand:+ start:44 stop:346 length:303 start_codon:yes stop_codon:yes gene_type:complete
MDKFNLRIIANPYLLRDNKNSNKSNIKTEIENNDLLYNYLEMKYKDTYISPILFYKVIQKIEKLIEEYNNEIFVKNTVEKIINECIDKIENEEIILFENK